MKKLSNEVKVGAIVLLTIVVFLWVFNFLKGKNLFNSTATYYTVYDKVGGLAESSPVEVNGYRVGIVQSISFVDAKSGRLCVVFSINKNFRIPKNTVAEIVPISLLGGMKVQFVYGDGPGFYEFRDTIPGRLAESLIDKIDSELMPVKDKLTSIINSIDSVIISVNDIMNADFRKDLRGTMANLKSTTGSINDIIGSKEEELKSTLQNLKEFSTMLSNNSGKLSNTFTSLENIADTLESAEIYSTIGNLKSSLEKTTTMLDNMNKGQGSAGKLLTNDSLYINLSRSLDNLNLLLKDVKANPKRYVHFSIFGKKSTPTD